MKKRTIFAAVAIGTLTILSGCGATDDATNQEGQDSVVNDQAASDTEEIIDVADLEELPNLEVRIGETDDRPIYEIQLEDNEVSLQFVRVLLVSDQTLPIYVFDGSENTDVLQYYDIPESYDIPNGEPVQVESQVAGEIYYSAPSRIILFYKDAQVSGDYVKVGTLTTTEGLEEAINNNPLDAWGNKRVIVGIAE